MAYPAYVPPAADRVDFDLGRSSPPNAHHVDFDLGSEQGGQSGESDPWADFRVSSPGGTAIPWGRLRAVDSGCRLPWRPRSSVHRECRLPWSGEAPVHPPEIRLPWRRVDPLPSKTARLPWQGEAPLGVPETRLPWWARLEHQARDLRLPWGAGRTLDREHIIDWWSGMLERRDFETRLPWGTLVARDQLVRIPWWAWKPPKDRLHRIFWGRELYERICLRGYVAPDAYSVNFHLRVPLAQVGDRDHVDFWFERLSYDPRCSQREPSGWRDNYFYQPPRPWPKAPKYTVWLIMNTATLIRTKDDKPVEVFSMNVKADIESWCWSFSAKIPAESLPLVSPEEGPVEVLATINGYSWLCMIESWSESRSFAQGEYNISGRSTSAELAAPYAPVITGMNEAERTSVQLTEEQLENTGWAIDWGEYESWLVPEGALSYSNTSALKVIQSVAEATGGRILTHRQNPTLLVVPRLHSLPWKWFQTTPDLGISEYVVKQLGREFLPGIAYNAVFVSGETQGVLVKVYRGDRVGEEVAAPMVTHALITEVAPAREHGRMILGRSGNWSRETLELPLTAPGELPGLLEIGMLVSMEEGNTVWRGQVTGVSVSAQWQNRGGIVVQQNIDVERYRGK